jgi:ABC-type sugar transport system substrate-binding protein
MLKKMGLSLLMLGIITTLLTPVVSSAADKAIYYWVSHGSPADPVWTYFLQGAEQWAKDTGNDVRTSFHSGDVPSQQEAVRAAISAKARGIVTSTPDPGSLTKVIADAHAAGIPVIIMSAATTLRLAIAGRNTWSITILSKRAISSGCRWKSPVPPIRRWRRKGSTPYLSHWA